MVIINEKICDNAPECSGIAVCPTGAIYWDDSEGKLNVDNDLCISCRRCVTDGCPVGAIKVTDNEEDYLNEKRLIEEDPHTVEDLFVERYGAAAIEEKVVIKKDEVESKLLENNYVFIEEFNDDSIQCLLHSIAIHDLRSVLNIDFEYYKCDVGVSDDSSVYPILRIYNGLHFLGKIEGYFDDSSFEDFVSKIKQIINE